MRERHGCLYWSLIMFAVMFAIWLVAYTLGAALALVVGVGSWLVMRLIWRAIVAHAPNSMIVDIWINRPPLARRAAAALVSLALAFVILFGYYRALAAAQEESRQRQAATTSANAICAVERDNLPYSAGS